MTSIDSSSGVSPGVDAQIKEEEITQLASPTSSTSSSSQVTIDPALTVLQNGVAELKGSTTSSSSKELFSVMARVLDSVTALVGAISTLISNLVPGYKPKEDSAISSTVSSVAANGANTVQPPTLLNVIKNDVGAISVNTFDGYTVRAEGREEAWSVTGPDGKTTRIFGDPHVKESDGDAWDFVQRSSFIFGKNKITAEVAPLVNGKTLTSKITIYSGEERVTIGGIDGNKPTILAVAKDGTEHDAGLADGITYKRSANSKGEAWTSNKK